MSNQFIQINPDSTGAKVQTFRNVIGGNTIESQAVAIVDSLGAAVSLLLDSTFTARINTLGQKTMANSTPVVLSSDQSAIPVTQSGSWTISSSNPSVGSTGAALPTSATLLGGSDGTNLQQLLVESNTNRNLRIGIYSGANLATVTGSNALKVDGSAVTQPVSGTVTANAGTGTFTNQQSNITTDYDTGAGTQTLTMFGMALPASGGAVAGGTSTNPIRIDPTGVTTQPISASSLPLPTGAATEGTLATLLLNSTFTGRINTLGQKTMANSTPVVLASDQTVIPVSQSGSWTVTANAGSNLNTSALALSATQTDRTQKTQITDGTRDGTVKAASTAALATDTSLVVALSPNSSVPAGSNTIGALTANQSVNVSQIAGTTTLTGNGVTGAGSQRVTVASDNTPFTVNAGQSGTWGVGLNTGSNTIGKVDQGAAAAASAWLQNLTQIGGTSILTGNGVTGAGSPRVTIASDNTAFSVNASQASSWIVTPSNTPNTVPWLFNISDSLNSATVKAASTAAATTDTSVVVALSPNSPVVQGTPTTVANAWPVKITDGTNTVVLGENTVANSIPVALANNQRETPAEARSRRLLEGIYYELRFLRKLYMLTIQDTEKIEDMTIAEDEI